MLLHSEPRAALAIAAVTCFLRETLPVNCDSRDRKSADQGRSSNTTFNGLSCAAIVRSPLMASSQCVLFTTNTPGSPCECCRSKFSQASLDCGVECPGVQALPFWYFLAKSRWRPPRPSKDPGTRLTRSLHPAWASMHSCHFHIIASFVRPLYRVARYLGKQRSIVLCCHNSAIKMSLLGSDSKQAAMDVNQLTSDNWWTSAVFAFGNTAPGLKIFLAHQKTVYLLQLWL